MEKAMTGQNCANCLHYDEYFTKQYTNFSSTKRGFCTKRKHPSNNQEVCHDWKDSRRHKETQKRLSIAKINDAADCLIEIAKLLGHDLQDEKIQ